MNSEPEGIASRVLPAAGKANHENVVSAERRLNYPLRKTGHRSGSALTKPGSNNGPGYRSADSRNPARNPRRAEGNHCAACGAARSGRGADAEIAASIEESVGLQREALKRQKNITLIAVPGILACIAAIAYLVLKYF